MTKAEKLREKYGGHWEVHPDWPRQDWISEVENGDTVLGYWDWVSASIENSEKEYDVSWKRIYTTTGTERIIAYSEEQAINKMKKKIGILVGYSTYDEDEDRYVAIPLPKE